MDRDELARSRFDAALGAGAPALLVDADSILAANLAAVQLVGLPEDALRLGGLALLHGSVDEWALRLRPILQGAVPAAAWDDVLRTTSSDVPVAVNATGVQRAGSSPPEFVAVVHLHPDRATVEDLDSFGRTRRRYDWLVEAAHEGLWEVDLTGRTVFVNPRMAAMLGCEPRDLVGGSILEVIEPTMAADARADLAAGSVRADSVDIRLRRPDGGHVWTMVSTTALRDASGTVTGALSTVVDVTERRQREADLRAAEALFRRTFDGAPIGMALVGLDGSWLRVNRAICRIVGRTEPELLACTFQDITHPDDLDADLELLGETLAGRRDGYVMEKRYLHTDGHQIWVNLTVGLLRDENEAPLYFISQIEDVTARRDAERQARVELEHQAAHDPLTGLLNRRGLEDVMRTTVDDERVSVLFVDLDGFKQINDRHGHRQGDDVLCQVAAALRHSVRATDVVARLGGDEFVVLLRDATPAFASATAARLHRAIRQLGDEHRSISATVGLAIDADGNSTADLLDRADAAMLQGKRAGKDRVAPEVANGSAHGGLARS